MKFLVLICLLLCAFVVVEPTNNNINNNNNIIFENVNRYSAKRSIDLNQPSYIPLGSVQRNKGNLQKAYSYILSGLDTHQSRFLIYPYPLKINDSLNDINFEEGALISLSPDFSDASGFDYLANSTDITLVRAKALYDVSVAILQLQQNIVNTSDFNDYTYDAYSYCTALHDWTGKYQQCFRSSDYLDYLSSLSAESIGGESSREETTVVYVNEVDIQNGFLFNNGTLRFGILIVPDISEGSQYSIIRLLSPSGVEAIRSFVSAGGTLFSAGKGAFVVELLGYFQNATFNPNGNYLTSKGFSAPVKCLSSSSSDPLPLNFFLYEKEWLQHSLCFSPPVVSGMPTAGITSSPLVSTSLLTYKHTVLAYWDPSSGSLVTKDNEGFLSTVPSTSNTSYPFIIQSNQDKGQVIVMTGSPTSDSSWYPWFFNVLFSSMARPLIMDSSLISRYATLPALEQITVDLQLNLTNFYDDDLASMYYFVYIAKGVSVQSSFGCSEVTVPFPFTVPLDCLNTSIYWDCSPPGGLLTQFKKQTNILKLYIEDPTITQIQYKIPLIYPIVNYIIPNRGGVSVTLDYGPVTVNAYVAAVMRTDMNADTMGTYPIMGVGNYIDTIQYTMNKENTIALNVQQYTVFPLITPVLDSSNQAMIIHTLDFDYAYYWKQVNQVKDYIYPFTSPHQPFSKNQRRDEDFIDWQLFHIRSALPVVDWDTPVSSEKLVRDPTIFGASLTNDSVNQPQGGIQVTLQEVTRERYYPDANNFYEHATQRIQPYLDTTQPEPFNIYNQSETWGSASPPSYILNAAGTALRYNLVFARQDVFWYPGALTPLPIGVTNPNIVFSLDRYASILACVPGLDNANTRLLNAVKGYFTSQITTPNGENAPGLKPNEYYNELRTNCDRAINWIDPSAPDAELPEGISMGHYIVSLEDSGAIGSGDDLMYFVKDPDAQDEWYYDPDGTLGSSIRLYGTYKELKVKYAWSTSLNIDPEISKKGGRITVSLPNTVSFLVSDPVSFDAITYASDQVTIKHTFYNSETNQIITIFKRGVMPTDNEGRATSVIIYLEFLHSTTLFPFFAYADVEEMLYDISAVDAQPDPFQRYELRLTDVELNFQRKLVLSLPTLIMKYELNRKGDLPDLKGSYVLPYENYEPFVRQGVYMQELKAHRTVYSTLENHPVVDTGLVGNVGSFSWVSNIGVSSVPFLSYLSTGAKQMIPAVPTASHLRWNDIWGREWIQPLRSVFPDVTPIPSSLRNFMVATTYELLKPDSNERVLQWQSDEPLIVRAQVKITNNYYKYFDVTACKENWVVKNQVPGSSPFSDKSTDMNLWLTITEHLPNYGQCFSENGTYVEGSLLNETGRNLIQNSSLCLKDDPVFECWDDMSMGPHVRKRLPSDRNDTIWWNYSPQVDRYYPQDYVDSTMWDMTHIDYDDTVYSKSYSYHLQNMLPNPDSEIIRPQNMLAFPIYKGIGYSISYRQNQTHPRFSGKSGWWSDNLQSRDNTLLAGQATINSISVGTTPSLISSWLPITSLTNASDYAAEKLKNLYICEFNRLRPSVDPSSSRYYYFKNVNYNNVVPVDYTLDKNDARLTDYQCDLTKPMYTPDTISQYPNYRVTDTVRDWLYFAAGLRGEAKETINVLYRLEPLPNRPNSGIEGMVNIQDGGRLVYWNPAFGPNLFQIVDNPSTVVIARRTDITVAQDVLPEEVSMTNAVVYHYLHLEDTKEKNREWKDLSYSNNYGFGDSTVKVYVGGFPGTAAVVKPGGSTIATITFYNNAGFDWNLKVSAFPLIDYGVVSISSSDLGLKIKHNIKVPTQYNFMSVEVPDELKPYITLNPANVFGETAPMQFDFSSNNVLSIRDGFRGDYFFNITVSADLPDSLCGRQISLPVTLYPEYFDQLPGPSDPTGIHDYTLSIPDIVFGVIGPDGKVYYTSGHAHDLQLTFNLNPAFTVVGVQYLNQSTAHNWLDGLRAIAAQPYGQLTNLNNYWFNLTTQNNDSISFNVTDTNVVSLDLSSKVHQFPMPPWGVGPEQAEIDLLVYTVSPWLAPGWVYPMSGLVLHYTDDVGKVKRVERDFHLSVRSAGANMSVSYTSVIYDSQMNMYVPQALGVSDTGYVHILATISNLGTGVAFRAKFGFDMAKGLSIASISPDFFTYKTIPSSNDGTIVIVDTGFDLPPYERLSIALLFSFISAKELFDIQKRSTDTPTSRSMVNSFTATIDLTSFPEELTVDQTINRTFSIPISSITRPVVTLSGSPSSGLGYRVDLTLNATELPSTLLSDILYCWYRRNVNFATSTTSQGTWVSLANTTSTTLTDVVGPSLPLGVVPQIDYMVSVLSASDRFSWTQSNVYQFRPDGRGIIIGIIVTTLVLLFIVAFLLWLFYRYKTASPSITTTIPITKTKKVKRRVPKSELQSQEKEPLSQTSIRKEKREMKRSEWNEVKQE